MDRVEKMSSILAEAKQIARVIVQVGRLIVTSSLLVPSHLLTVIELSSVQESRYSSVDCEKKSCRLMVKLHAVNKVIIPPTLHTMHSIQRGDTHPGSLSLSKEVFIAMSYRSVSI